MNLDTARASLTPPDALRPEAGQARRWLRIFAIVALLGGATVRIAQYSYDRSLWLDEAMLAVNIVHRSPGELLLPLSHNQGAPILFLLAEKAVTVLLGNSEAALRLIPLLASLASLALFHAIAARLLGAWTLAAASLAVAFSPQLVYYAQETKQYSVDVAIALALILGAVALLDRPRWTWPRAASLGVLGSVAIFLSHPGVLAVAAIGCVLVLKTVQKQAPRAGVVILGSLWLGCLAVNYVHFLGPLSANAALQEYWIHGFFVAPVDRASLITDLKIATGFAHFAGFTGFSRFVALILAGCGVVALIRGRSALGLTLVALVLMAALASFLGRYPLERRLALYLVPVLVLFASAGIDALSRTRVRRAVPALACLLAGMIAVSGYDRLLRPMERENARAILAHLQHARRPGEHVYLYFHADVFAQYYWGKDYRRNPDFVVGQGFDARERPELYLADIKAMRAWDRVWFVFVHDSMGIEAYFREHLPGRVVEERREQGACVFLVDFDAPGFQPAVASSL